jgi:hypothetical protein
MYIVQIAEGTSNDVCGFGIVTVIVFVIAQHIDHMWESLTASFEEFMISSATICNCTLNIVVVKIVGHTDIS